MGVSHLSCITVANSFSGNRNSVYSLCMDHDGKVLASGSSDKVRVCVCVCVCIGGGAIG